MRVTGIRGRVHLVMIVLEGFFARTGLAGVWFGMSMHVASEDTGFDDH